ncbi:putative transcriptional regulator, Crp/Fnr family [Methyloglobulus morosus KoM1]|uniref:Putative transcriptional regulator, Crp/Fnr family n=1 Tax=Methyloglobulus morosus KoM1 TaxID=1116472 RepID=V5DU74_9GAMM|nr:cyclic nucleotide-binding domain-containing protein [Methyloglobulus morosus]ESS70976.1 putative transcriptional regulator, Crp/Fnr family [Methyloglobulus morosus KoM1]
MAVQSNSDESRILRRFYPLATFPSEAFKELCANVTVEQIQDAALFKKGDTNADLVYLLDGSVSLQSEGLVVEVIDSESESAKFALAHQLPRKIDAIANGVVRIVRLDAHTVNNPPPAVFREDQGYTVIEESAEDSDDWMTAVLRLPLFQALPPANLQKILISLKTTQFAEGEVIIAKGSEVEYFYIIKKGQCLLSRKPLDGHSEIKLGAGESFGEEYLITDKPAQETITALSDVSLIQLEKKHFLTQIKAPTLTFISHEAMPDAVKNGAVLLDVRLPHLYENSNLDSSANIPLSSLRMRIAEIPKDKQVIVVCGNGKESEAGAFLLLKNKFNATVLKEGVGIEEEEGETDIADVGDNQQDTLQASPHDSDNISKEISESTALNPETEIKLLKAENERLIQLNCDLEKRNATLQAEKDQAENQCEVLTQQIERLKGILNRFTKRQ